MSKGRGYMKGKEGEGKGKGEGKGMGEEKGRKERVINLPDKCETAPYAPKIAVAL